MTRIRFTLTVFICEERVLAVSMSAARARLADLVDNGWLGTAAEAAYWGGTDQLRRVAPLADVPGLAGRVRVEFLDAADQGDSVTVGMRWTIAGVAGGLFPAMDADIRLAAEGEESTHLMLTGVYRPPLGVVVGAGLDRALLHRVAAVTVGSLLTQLALALAGVVPAAAGAGAGGGREPGPEAAL